MGTTYDKDIVAWSAEQAALLRAGRLSELDIEHIAEEIEDVGKSEQRELASRMVVLLAHLLKWVHQPGLRSASWQVTIKTQRTAIARRLSKTPSLRPLLADPEEIDDWWGDARVAASHETGLDILTFPEACPWTMAQAIEETFWPD
ncbi:DUF29 domain-containing protein [Burkholderia sp. Ac-20349]|uniref:DUF29 domain-containing protein n=1 Tax=Burkholderia sp. Ac-20349 TaxID=2703893 RepID=UPI00197B4FE7|nr:DUF29 domain-containing protein [Burkholderia sp. Ac-20349]MBN3839258.1 DUF29 domain-containing protein [Burkholderia sp. Ac-20349]